MVLVLAGAAAALAASAPEPGTLGPLRPPRAALFRATGFPTVDAPQIPGPVLDAALAGLAVDTYPSVDALRQGLREGDHAVLVLPYGSAFPLAAWPEIRAFVAGGGGLVVLGGAPFHQPVHADGTGWRLGSRQPTFAHDFLIGPAEPVATAGLAVGLPEPSWSLPIAGARRVWELTLRLGRQRDLPEEHGAEAYRDAVARPLVHLVDAEGVARGCPLVEIDRLRGSEAGARWIFAPSDAALPAATVRAIVERALAGAVELDARPVHASIEPGELAAIRVVLRRPRAHAGQAAPERAELVVRETGGREVHRETVALSGLAEARHGEAVLRPEAPLKPGLYEVEVTTPGAPWQPQQTATGFWVRDAALLAAGPRLTVSRDWLRRDGAVFPVIGTTYMASDVHRKFLFEPNPLVWDRDFALMARLGVGMVRTGLWTAWSRAMLDPAAVDEGFLRALDAYVQSAARHGVLVNFTFFAFLPPAFGGSNPYLDPRALDGQRDLLTLVARRYRGVGWVHWDLINEPSYAPPERLWSHHPIGDGYERAAWGDWVRAHHGDDPARLRDRWRDSGGDPFAPPADDQLGTAAIREGRMPRKSRDFAVFAQEVVAGWAARMRGVLREAGGDLLVTLGQDEGGTWLRPAQQLHAGAVDYTSVHPWWQNDDVLSTGVLTKVPEKPNLFQEVGLMRLEDEDGSPWRSPEDAADALERKFAAAFASRGAGAVEWAWNINPYMPIDNESVIGFWRPDGTAKPELRVIPDFAGFFRVAAPYLDDFEPDPVVVVVPHSRLFMGRPGATDGVRRIVRLLAERFGVVPTALSELRLTPERLRDARLVIVPSPELLERTAIDALLAASRTGTKVLITGAILGDPYGDLPESLGALGANVQGRPVRLHEATPWGGGDATFDRDLRESLRRSLAPPLGKLTGPVWHEPLPLEHAREDGPLFALLAAALAAAGVGTHPGDGAVAARLLYAPRAVLAICVNESARDVRRSLTVEGHAVDVPVAAGRSRLVLLERPGATVLAATPGDPVVVRKGRPSSH
jgi:hypothetical protein